MYTMPQDHFAMSQVFSSIKFCLPIFINRYSLTPLKMRFIIILRDMLSKTCFGMALSSRYTCHRSNQIFLSVTLFLL